MTIKVKLRGGLGNQLFLYSAGYALSQKHGVELELHTSLLSRQNYIRSGVSRWKEQISDFEHSGTIVVSKNESAISSRFVQSFAGLQRKIGDYGVLARAKSELFAYEANENFSHYQTLGPNAILNAYCNSPLFFSGFEDDLREQITNLRAPSDWYLQMERMVSEVKPIILHVRWGDYLNLKHIYGEISAEYYSQSLDLISQLQKTQQPVWLSSDDVQGASEFLANKIRLDFVMSPPKESSSLEALIILGGGSSLVAANSSFSWWAGFLGQRTQDFKVIFPRPLFAQSGPPDPKNWLLPSWLQLGR